METTGIAFSDPRKTIAEVPRILKDDGLLVIAYFPPAIGGIVQQGDSHWRQLIARLYQFLIRRRGYVDHIDQLLEPMTISCAKDHVEQVGTVDSGEHWRLVIARGIR
jgi:hypothetical protein